MKITDGIKNGFGVTLGSIMGLYVGAVLVGLISAGRNKSEKSDATTDQEES